jgi:hypothetical protein
MADFFFIGICSEQTDTETDPHIGVKEGVQGDVRLRFRETSSYSVTVPDL